MRAFTVQATRHLEPFGDHPRDCLIINRPLADHQSEVLTQLGWSLAPVTEASAIDDPDEHIVFDDNLFFSKELMAEFVARSRALRCPTVCALPPGLHTLRSIVATQDVQVYPDRVEYGLHYVPTTGSRGDCQPIIIDPEQFREVMRFPRHMSGADEYEIPLTDRVIAHIDHWVNLWAVNVALLLSTGAKLKKSSPFTLLGLALKARSTNQWKVLRQVNRVGRGCDIHPTAYIEGSTVGDNVKIGAGAIIREAVLGAGAQVGNGAIVELSVIGDRCYVHNGTTVQYSVVYPDTNIGTRFCSLALIGREVMIGDGVVLTDFRLDGHTVSVMKNGARIDTQNPFIGTCLGHGTCLGSGTVLAPGRMVPNGWRLAPDESRVIEKCTPEGVPGYRLLTRSPRAMDAAASERMA